MLVIHENPVDNFISLTAAKLHLKVENTADDELIKTLISAVCDYCKKREGQTYMATTYKLYLDGFSSVINLKYPPVISVDSIQYVDTSGDTQTLASSVYTVDGDSFPGRIYLAYQQSWPSTRSIPKAVTITYKAGYSTTFTSTFATDTLTVGNSVFSDGDRVRLSTDSGDLPDGLSVMADYYVRDVSGSALKLAATSGGDAISLSDDGSGTHYIGFADFGNVPDRVLSAAKLILTHLYEHRSENSDFAINQIPFSAENLLLDKVW